MTKQHLFLLAIIGAILFVTATILGGLQFESYSHIAQYISETYALGTPYGNYLRFLGFAPSGLCIATFAFVAPRVLPKSKRTTLAFWGIGVFYGIGTFLVSVFPCSEGCIMNGVNTSTVQLIHNLFAILTYLIVPFCLIIIGTKAHHWHNGVSIAIFTILCGMLAAGVVILLFSNPFGPLIGLYQRIIEGAILAWLVSLAFYLKKNPL